MRPSAAVLRGYDDDDPCGEADAAHHLVGRHQGLRDDRPVPHLGHHLGGRNLVRRRGHRGPLDEKVRFDTGRLHRGHPPRPGAGHGLGVPSVHVPQRQAAVEWGVRFETAVGQAAAESAVRSPRAELRAGQARGPQDGVRRWALPERRSGDWSVPAGAQGCRVRPRQRDGSVADVRWHATKSRAPAWALAAAPRPTR